MCVKSLLVQISVAIIDRKSRDVSFLVTDNLLLRRTGYFMLLASVVCLNHILQSVCQHQVCGNMAAIWLKGSSCMDKTCKQGQHECHFALRKRGSTMPDEYYPMRFIPQTHLLCNRMALLYICHNLLSHRPLLHFTAMLRAEHVNKLLQKTTDW